MSNEVHFPPFLPLPELARNAADVPGGLRAEPVSDETFRVAGVKWSPADAEPTGSPIGYVLAAESACAPDDDSLSVDASSS